MIFKERNILKKICMDIVVNKLITAYQNDDNFIDSLKRISITINNILVENEKKETRKMFVSICNEIIEKICNSDICKNELTDVIENIEYLNDKSTMDIFVIRNTKFFCEGNNFNIGNMIKIQCGGGQYIKNINTQILYNFYKELKLKNSSLYLVYDFLFMIATFKSNSKMNLGLEIYKTELAQNKYESLKRMRQKYPRLFITYVVDDGKGINVMFNEKLFDNKKNFKEQIINEVNYRYHFGKSKLYKGQDGKIYVDNQQLKIDESDKSFYEELFK